MVHTSGRLAVPAPPASVDTHAVTSTRNENGTFTQTFNAENKLVQVSGAASASFSYDGGLS